MATRDDERVPSDQNELDIAAVDPLAGPYMDLEDAIQRDRLHARLFDSEPEPRMIGRWYLLKCVGRGGSGAVYAAYDPKLDRRVAVKCLRVGAGMDEEHARQRVVREAQAMAKLSHPNVVQVYDVNAEDGEVYVVMEYIQGATLREWQKKRLLTDIVDAYEQAGRGLVCLHGAGLVHRDIKPDNILVASAKDKDKGQGRVVVGDLGLVHAIEPSARTEDLPVDNDSALDVPITREGTRLGTWQYMAPEQLRGDATDARSDQFAFCVSLYEAMCRVRPFARAAERTGALITAIERGTLEPPEVRVSGRLMRVVQRGLAPRPEDRFRDMDALLRALQRARRSRWPWLAGILVILLATGLLLTLQSGWFESPSCEAEAENKLTGIWDDPQTIERWREHIGGADAWRALDEAAKDAKKEWNDAYVRACKLERGADHDSIIRELIEGRMACLNENERWMRKLGEPPADSPDDLTLGYRLAKALQRRPDCGFPDDALRSASLLKAAGSKERLEEIQDHLATAEREEFLGHYGVAVTAARKAQSMARLVGSSELEVLAQYRLGHVLASRGEITEAVAALLASARNAEVYRMHLDAADSWLYLAKIATEDLKDVDKAGEWTMAVLRVMFKGDGSRVADYHELRGLQAFLAGQYKAAAYEHEYALNIRRSQGPTGDPIAFSKSLNNLANTLAMHGDPDEARKHYQGALTERVKALGPDHPLVGEVVFNLGRLEASEKNWNEARHFFQHALRIDQATHGSDHPGTLHTLLAWAFTELQANGIDRAEKLTNQIVTIHRRLKAENDPAARLPIRAQEHLMIAAVHEKREHIEDALAEVLAAIDIYEANKVEKTRSRESANYAWALWDAAKFYCKLGQSKLARKRTLEALALQDRWYEEDAAVLRGEMREEMDKQCRP